MPIPSPVGRRAVLAGGTAAGAALLAAPTLAGPADARNVALARRHLIDIWQEGRTDEAGDILHPDFVDHDPGPGQAPGIPAYLALARLIKVAMPDQHFEFVKLFAADDLVVDHWILRATHTGPLGAIPATGRKVVFHGCDIVRIQDDRIIEIWHVEDMLTMFAQLGLVQAPRVAA